MRPPEDVLFVGAGLSASFGYALTREILPRIIARSNSNELFERALEAEASMLRLEFAAQIDSLLPGILTADRDDLPAITDVLSLIDHLLLLRQAPSPEMMLSGLERLRSLFELAICELLSLSVDMTREIESRILLDQLADWIVQSGTENAPVAIITTNYDFVLEDAICRRLKYLTPDFEQFVDYGFSWRSTVTGSLRHRPNQPLVRFIRLHGAVNWLRCRMCGFVYINQRGPIFHQTDRAEDDIGNTCHCSARRLQRVIVAPSIVRTVDDSDLQTIWKAALEELRLSARWIFLGYSLPNEDVAIRSILIRALRGRNAEPRVEVYEHNSALLTRYKLLFPNVKFSSAGVEEFIGLLPN